jgi:hypothetical protein
MPEVLPSVRSRFRAPNGKVLLHGPVAGEQATHAVFVKDAEADRWSFVGVYGTRQAAEHKLENQTISAPAIECLIIECEPY